MNIIDTKYYRYGNTTACIITARLSNGVVRDAMGIAERHPTDRNNTKVGKSLAYGRAMARIVARENRIAEGAAKHAADIAQFKHTDPPAWLNEAPLRAPDGTEFRSVRRVPRQQTASA